MIARDLRYSVRTLIKQRGFTGVAILTLAIALAANTAIFSVVNAILLRPLPFASPDRMVTLNGFDHLHGNPIGVFSYPNYIDVRTQTKTLEQVTAFMRGRAFLMEGDEPEGVHGRPEEPQRVGAVERPILSGHVPPLIYAQAV